MPDKKDKNLEFQIFLVETPYAYLVELRNQLKKKKVLIHAFLKNDKLTKSVAVDYTKELADLLDSNWILISADDFNVKDQCRLDSCTPCSVDRMQKCELINIIRKEAS